MASTEYKLLYENTPAAKRSEQYNLFGNERNGSEIKKRIFASFSGGRTSAMMTKFLLDNYSDKYEIITLFANTGEENEKTLEFVHQCDINFNFRTVWLEAVVKPGRNGTAHRVVTFETASRRGEPFEDVIKKYGIPNKSYPHCTRELKLNPMYSYLRSIGWTKGTYSVAIGIRADETRRVSKSADADGVIYPLIDMLPMDKQDVNDWWEHQAFNLELLEHQGNCKWCWKKSFRKHFRLIQETPEIYEFPRRMEREYGMSGSASHEGRARVFFRMGTSTDDLFTLADYSGEGANQRRSNDLDANGGCSESCELFPMDDNNDSNQVMLAAQKGGA